ncbi:oligosaccharide flippase family protein [Plebeiibacterium marinum]|uniref:Oligosaccharide flippase family protein n=1 Tax=Plebeiibacterium marinum TaxID=2992111 RepID=A0AAE3SJS8_9BACT|nr:oligosaccharide flippase family protein [Plebeiobacterium marinum]MCW3805809.1 oligosaccharide flippase family protein [Plebeiobacterium marinum]
MSKVNVLKNSIFYTIGNIVPKAAQFLLLPLYTQYLSPEEFGLVNSINILILILTILFSLSLDKAIFRLYHDYNSTDKRTLISTLFLLMSLVSIVLLTICFVFKNVVSLVYETIPFYPYYIIAFLITYFNIFSLLPKALLQVEQNALGFIKLTLSEFLLNTGVIVLLVVIWKQGALGMLLGLGATSVLFLPYYFTFLIKRINWKFDRLIAVEVIKYSLPLVPMILASWILNVSDRVFLERFIGLKSVGIYSLGYKMSEIVLVFSTAFNKAYEPYYYKIANMKNISIISIKEKLKKINDLFVSGILYISFLVILFTPEIVGLLDERYLSAKEYVPILIIGIAILQISGLFGFTILQSKKSKFLMYSSLVSAIMNIGLNILFIPKYGVYGAAYSTTLCFLLLFIIKYYFSKKAFFISFNWKLFFFQIMFLCGVLITVRFLTNVVNQAFIIKGSVSLITLILLLREHSALMEQYESYFRKYKILRIIKK